ncbi:MAG TPA: hypothetical protein PLU64_18975 [Saprospiraceae bacterium]|nr:hypothetical protein [Saprospiraceae bacterium]
MRGERFSQSTFTIVQLAITPNSPYLYAMPINPTPPMEKMTFKDIQWKEIGEQFRYTLFKLPEAYRFIREQKLWRGIWDYSWLTRVLMFLAVILALKFFGIFISWVRSFHPDSAGEVFSSMGVLAGRFFKEGFGFILGGGAKYGVIVLAEILVFHFSRKALDIINGDEGDANLKDFFKAQTRSIKVGLYAWVVELAISGMLGIAFGIFSSVALLKPALLFVAQCYLLGFTIIDNFNEQYELTIKESLRYTLRYAGIATAIGLTTYLLLLIPLAGAIAGTVLTSVAATLVMFELSDLHAQRKEALTVPESEGNAPSQSTI